MQSLEANDYYLADRLEEAGGPISEEERVDQRLSQDSIVGALAEVPHDFRDVVVLVDRSSTSRSERSCHVCIEDGVS